MSLRGVQLVQYAAGEDPLRIEGQWWSEREGGLVGGVAGSLIGLLGVLASVLPLALAATLRKRYDGLAQARSAGPGSRS